MAQFSSRCTPGASEIAMVRRGQAARRRAAVPSAGDQPRDIAQTAAANPLENEIGRLVHEVEKNVAHRRTFGLLLHRLDLNQAYLGLRKPLEDQGKPVEAEAS